MSDRSEIPWNKKPKNGITAFFTEATFSRWIPEENHEARLAASLEKICKGVILPKVPPYVERKDADQIDVSIPGTECEATTEPVDVIKSKDEKAVTKTNDSQAIKQDSFREIPREVCQESELNKDVDISDGISNGNPKSDDKLFMGGKLDSVKREGKSVTDAMARAAENQPPESNEFLTGPITQERKGPEAEMKEGPGVNVKLPTSPKLSPSKETELNDAEKRKKAIECNFYFYNDQDRKDKYVPLLAKKRPRSQKPNLTPQEQKSYLDMKRKFAKLDLSQLNPQQEADYEIFKGLLHRVEVEQQKFMKFLRYAFTQCEDDYRYIHTEVEKYIGEKFLVKKKRVTQFPRFYQPVKRVDLTEGSCYSAPRLEYVQPLLQLGTVPRMVLPQVVSGLPQPCIPTDSQRVTNVCPIVRDVVKGVCVWDHEECSQDLNAEQLAVPNKCDFVFTSSAIKHLVEHQAFHGKLWNMPVTVRDYCVQEGDKTVIHKIIYVDKPLIKTTQYTVQDRNKLYQKYALKSVAIRTKNKPHVFSNIKPSSEVVKYVKIEDVKKDVEEYDLKVKEDKANSDGARKDSDNKDWMLTKKNRKPKKNTPFDYEDIGQDKTGVGVFDLENEIDDLETFGMEKSGRMPARGEKNPEILSLGKDLDSRIGSKGRKTLETDLEMFKGEFEGLNARKLGSGTTGIEDHQEITLSGTAGSKILSKKGLPSLSERLRQMSNIRSKLNMKPIQSDLSASAANISENLNGQTDKDVHDDAVESNKSMETESDSDQSDDGLVIDVPTIPEPRTEQVEISPNCSVVTLGSGENSKITEDEYPSSLTQGTPGSLMKSAESQVNDSNFHVTRESEDEIEAGNVNNSDSKIDTVGKTNTEKPDATVTNTADKPVEDNCDQPPNLVIDMETSGMSTRGSKRRSVEIQSEESTPKRRSLRSYNSAGESEVLQTGHYTRQSVRKNTAKLESPNSNVLSEQTKESEKTRTVPTDRITRSKSASAEVTGAENTSPFRRVTRKSLGSDEIHNDSEKIIPRKRGKTSSKNVAETKKEEDVKEARKIKEMAETMRKKIGEKCEENSEKDGTQSFQNSKTLQTNKMEKKSKIGCKQETRPKTSHGQSGSGVLNQEYENEKAEDITEAANNAETSQKEENLGIDNILSLQTKLWKPVEKKGTASGSFAAKHGMSKVMFPLAHNVTYHQWKFGDFNLLIRCSYHGYANPQGFVHIATKLEYQPYYGFEKQAVSDIAKNWMSAYIRPKCTLVRARINPYNSEIMMMDSVELNDLIPPNCGFRPTKAMGDLQCILEGLKDLPAGQYLVNNQPKRDHVTVFKAAPEGERGPFDLHYYHATQKIYLKGKEPIRARWVPIDTELLLQHQKRLNLIPCTFTVNEAQGKSAQVKEQKSGKKKKKRKQKKKKA